MAGAIALSAIRTRIRQRTDNEHTGSSFVTDSELTGLVNVSYSELYGELVRAGLHMSESVQTVTATGASTYALNSDLFAVIGVFRVDGTHRSRLVRHSVRHRPDTSVKGPASSYRVIGTTVTFHPLPVSGTYEVVYVPVPGTLSADADTVEGILGWEEYLVLDVSIKVLDKEETDARHLRAERERLLARIRDEAALEEMSEGSYIDNVRSRNSGTDDEAEYNAYRGVRGSSSWWRS